MAPFFGVAHTGGATIGADRLGEWFLRFSILLVGFHVQRQLPVTNYPRRNLDSAQ